MYSQCNSMVDPYPDPDDRPRRRKLDPLEGCMEEAKRDMEERRPYGHMAKDWDPHDPTKDKEETR